MGEIATAGGFFTYFIVMRLYGFPPNILFGLLGQKTYYPKDNIDFNDPSQCVFDTQMTNLGCTIFPPQCNEDDFKVNEFPDWLSLNNNKLDLRPFYSKCQTQGTDSIYVPAVIFPTGEDYVLNHISPISGYPIKYSVEALFYAQSSYFVTVVMVQWSNVFACKSRKVNLLFILGFPYLFRI